MVNTDRLCDAFPWPEMAIVGFTCLALGIAIGFVWGRVSKSSNSGESMTARLHATYNRWAWLFAVLIGVLALLGIWIGTVASVTNGRQDSQRAAENEARDKQTTELLKCFDQYAQAASSSSTAVRAAQVKVDEATGIRDDALAAEGDAFYEVVQRILAHTATAADFQRLADTLEVRSRNSRVLDQAQATLDKARRDNPVPPPPSSFCGTSLRK